MGDAYVIRKGYTFKMRYDKTHGEVMNGAEKASIWKT